MTVSAGTGQPGPVGGPRGKPVGAAPTAQHPPGKAASSASTTACAATGSRVSSASRRSRSRSHTTPPLAHTAIGRPPITAAIGLKPSERDGPYREPPAHRRPRQRPARGGFARSGVPSDRSSVPSKSQATTLGSTVTHARTRPWGSLSPRDHRHPPSPDHPVAPASSCGA